MQRKKSSNKIQSEFDFNKDHKPISIERHDRIRSLIDSVLIGLGILFASFGEYSYPGQYFPPMNYLFELFISYGRYISIAFFLMLILLHSIRQKNLIFLSVKKIRGALAFFWVLQFYFLLKMLYFGNTNVFLLGIFVLAIQLVVLHLYLASSERIFLDTGLLSLDRVVLSICFFSVPFALINFLSYILYPESSLAKFNLRFFGTMVNPMHFMMTAVLSIPALLYCMRSLQKFSLIWVLLILTIGVLTFLVYATGSRAGLALLVFIFAFGVREVFSSFKLFPILLIVAMALIIVGPDLYVLLGGDISSKFIVGREDTRSHIWLREWQEFLDNPLFGVSPDKDGRLIFTVTLWLSYASNGGILAIAFAVGMLFYMMKITMILILRLQRTSLFIARSNMYLTVMVSFLALSIFESVFAGLYTSMTMLCIVYLAGISEFTRKRKTHFVSNLKPEEPYL